MRTIGHRKAHPIAFSASAALLVEGAHFNDELHKFPAGNTTFVRKGVYRFNTHEEANRHAENCLAAGVAQTALDRAQWNNSAARRRSTISKP